MKWSPPLASRAVGEILISEKDIGQIRLGQEVTLVELTAPRRSAPLSSSSSSTLHSLRPGRSVLSAINHLN